MNKIKQTITTTCFVTYVSLDEIMSKSRERHIVDARRMVFCICRDLFKLPFLHIGKYFKLDHATIIHHYKKHSSLLKYDKIYENHYNTILELVKADFGIIEVEELIKEIQHIKKIRIENQIKIKNQIERL